MKIIFRKANLKDISYVLKLENLCFKTDLLSSSSFRYFIKTGKSDFIIVLSAKKEVVGYFIVLYRNHSKRARLYSIALNPQWQGKGLGRRFLKKVVSLAKKKGKSEIYLEVKDSNFSAIKLYKNMGFVIFGEKLNYYMDGRKAYRMKKQLK
jgi:ribosomal-protein-alanine acetyltransferase